MAACSSATSCSLNPGSLNPATLIVETAPTGLMKTLVAILASSLKCSRRSLMSSTPFLARPMTSLKMRRVTRISCQVAARPCVRAAVVGSWCSAFFSLWRRCRRAAGCNRGSELSSATLVSISPRIVLTRLTMASGILRKKSMGGRANGGNTDMTASSFTMSNTCSTTQNPLSISARNGSMTVAITPTSTVGSSASPGTLREAM
mmetsp:Transcript_21193/g.63133  ORF Transcript_21193/g.63133 Transcript_21193/m.63133 type:complete len:204 (+) Transcript_21193:292-903(+)